jgi:hypothetical protein
MVVLVEQQVSATANPINGNPPYTYKWSNNKTTQTITNLSAGTYTLLLQINVVQRQQPLLLLHKHQK